MLVRWAEVGRVDYGLKPDLVSVRNTKTPVEAQNTEKSPLATPDIKDRGDAWSFASKDV
jgi:hypothetical protein